MPPAGVVWTEGIATRPPNTPWPQNAPRGPDTLAASRGPDMLAKPGGVGRVVEGGRQGLYLIEAMLSCRRASGRDSW